MWGTVPCAERNGPIFYYVLYNPTSDPSDRTTDFAYDYDINNTVMSTVRRLIPGTEYTIVVIPTVIYYYSTGIPSDTLTVTTGLSQGSVV